MNKTKAKMVYMLTAVLVAASGLQAQRSINFTTALGSGSAHRYGRDALYTDTLAQMLYKGGLKPVAGAIWYNEGGVTKTWTAVQADSTNTYRDREMNNGYLYLSCHVAKAQPAILTISGHSMAYFNGEAHAGDQYR